MNTKNAISYTKFLVPLRMHKIKVYDILIVVRESIHWARVLISWGLLAVDNKGLTC